MSPSCIAYRSGLRRALAEVTILKVEAEARISADRCAANQGRRTRATAFSTARNRINDILAGPCLCGVTHFAIKRRVRSSTGAVDDGLAEYDPRVLRLLGILAEAFPRRGARS